MSNYSSDFEILKHFDEMPDDAVLKTKITALLLGLSEKTVRNHPQLDHIWVSEGRRGQGVGSIRRLVRSSTPNTAA
jgi:hypothetical protein